MTMTAFVKLNLPPLPSEVIQEIRLSTNTLAFDKSKTEWMNSFHGNELNCANHDYFIHDGIAEQVNSVYGKIFNQTIAPLVGIQRNTTNHVGLTPPHLDRIRYTAINFMIDLGGDSVTTNFYDCYREEEHFNTAKNIHYNEINKVDGAVFGKYEWCAFNAQQCNSVENIENIRIFLGLRLEKNIKFDDFLVEYKDLIVV